MPAVTGDAIERKAIDLAAATDRQDAVDQLLALAGGDRDALGAARVQVARRLRADSGDHTATAALTLLNKALVQVGWVDRYDWKIRWTQRFKRP
jgi:hypothetical protein